MKSTNEFAYMSGWIAAFTLAGAIFIRVVWSNENLKELACGKQDINCFRDWVSALGGWAAVAAAVPTIIYLSRQIRQAQLQHRDRLIIDLRQSIVLAKNVDADADAITTWESYIEILEKSLGTTLWPELIKKRIADLAEVLERPSFDKFEREIEFPNAHPARFLRDYLRGMQAHIGLFYDPNHVATADDWDKLQFDFHTIRQEATSYAEEIRKLAMAYRIEYTRLVASYSK